MKLMAVVTERGYRDPRWATAKQLFEKGYHIKAGEHGTICEKWIFEKEKKTKDEHGSIVREVVQLDRPQVMYFRVFNGEQVEGFPEDVPSARDESRTQLGDMIDHTDSVFWIKQKPLYENRQYAQFLMPDGKNSIFIRQADILPGKDEKSGMRLAAVFMDQRYSMMNLEKVNVVAADGSKAIAMFKLPGEAVIAHSSQQPDRKKIGPEMSKSMQKKEMAAERKTAKMPEKMKSR